MHHRGHYSRYRTARAIVIARDGYVPPDLSGAEADSWVDVPYGEFAGDIGNTGHGLSWLEHEHCAHCAP